MIKKVVISIAIMAVSLFAYKYSNSDKTVVEELDFPIKTEKEIDSKVVKQGDRESPTASLERRVEESLEEPSYKPLTPNDALTNIRNFDGIFANADTVSVGEQVLVKSFYPYAKNSSFEDIIIVPAFEDGIVYALLEYSDYENNNYFTEASISDVRGYGWKTYPPIPEKKAYQILRDKGFKNLIIYENSLYHLGQNRPLYAYTASNSSMVLFIDAYDGTFEQIAEESEPEQAELLPNPGYIDADGFMVLNDEFVQEANLSDIELGSMKLELEITNYLIRNGYMKFSMKPPYEVLEDNRTEEIWQQHEEAMSQFKESNGEDDSLFREYFTY